MFSRCHRALRQGSHTCTWYRFKCFFIPAIDGRFFIAIYLITVDGRNPAPLGIYTTPVTNGINYLSLNWCTPDFWLPSTVRSPPKTSFPLEPFESSLAQQIFRGFGKPQRRRCSKCLRWIWKAWPFPTRLVVDWQVWTWVDGRGSWEPPSTVDIPICCIYRWTIPIYNLPLAAGKKYLVSIHSARDWGLLWLDHS